MVTGDEGFFFFFIRHKHRLGTGAARPTPQPGAKGASLMPGEASVPDAGQGQDTWSPDAHTRGRAGKPRLWCLGSTAWILQRVEVSPSRAWDNRPSKAVGEPGGGSLQGQESKVPGARVLAGTGEGLTASSNCGHLHYPGMRGRRRSPRAESRRERESGRGPSAAG